MKSKILIIALSLLLLVSLTGCGKKTDATLYEIWLYTGQDTSFYSDYAENPALNYLLKNTWNGKNLSFKFTVPPAGTAQSNYQTMISSGDFPTLMQDSVADPAPVMYENGIIVDMTKYVKEYMPNYYRLIQENRSLKDKVCFTVDGEEKILSISTVNESTPYVTYGGMAYRRDWLVQYGTNASTGKAFTGGYENDADVDSWADDVVFPSWYDEAKKQKGLAVNAEWDGTSPMFISDWEWMFGIFTEAQKQLGINDSYCVSMYYPGYTWAGGLCSCFGEGGIVWYQGTDGKVLFGGSSDSTRAYFECLNNWYNQGWLDRTFNERTRDAFYAIDTTAVRQGKVGMWCSVQGDLGGRIDMHDGGLTEGIFVAGCSYPINDLYGNEGCRFVKPRVMNVDTSLVGVGFFVMKGAEEKDLASLCTFLDYLYTEEGAVIRTLGLSDAQLSEEGTDRTIYDKFGLSDGAYTIGADGRYVLSSVITSDSGNLSGAVNLNKLPGIELVKSVDYGYSKTLENSLKSWVAYKNSGMVWGSTAMMNMTTADQDQAQQALTKVLNYMEENAYKFIRGDKSVLNDKDWKQWCDMLERYKTDNISRLLQPYLDQYPISE